MFITSFFTCLYFLLITQTCSAHLVFEVISSQTNKQLERTCDADKTVLQKLCLGFQLKHCPLAWRRERLRGKWRAAFHLLTCTHLPTASLMQATENRQGWLQTNKAAKSVLGVETVMKTMIMLLMN